MKTSGVSEVRKRFSAFLRMVEHGERVAITRRGRVVAELRPAVYVTENDKYAERRRRVRAGTARLGSPNRPDLYPCPCHRLPSQVVRDLLDAVRGERNEPGPRTCE